MLETLLTNEPRTIAVWFMVAYLYCWFLCTSDISWAVVGTALCVSFYRFTISLSDIERDTIPPLTYLCLAWHCLAMLLAFVKTCR